MPITVVNKGVPRQSTRRWWSALPTDVIPEDPVLVIWETGITDAVRGIEVDDFAAALQTGIDEVKNRAIDIVLVDMQFSRSTATVIDFERYLKALHRVGDLNDVYVFPRFEMMRYWSEQNVFNFDEVAAEERARQLAAKVYDCIGRKLAEAIRTRRAMTRLAALRRCPDRPRGRYRRSAVGAIAAETDRAPRAAPRRRR